MTRRLVFLVVFAVLAVAGLAARAADPVEAFIRHSDDPTQFEAADLAPDYRGEVVAEGKRTAFTRDQVITLAFRLKGATTNFQLKSLKILELRTGANIIHVKYLAHTKVALRGGSYDMVYRVDGDMRRGGPNGFVWLNQSTEVLSRGS